MGRATDVAGSGRSWAPIPSRRTLGPLVNVFTISGEPCDGNPGGVRRPHAALSSSAPSGNVARRWPRGCCGCRCWLILTHGVVGERLPLGVGAARCRAGLTPSVHLVAAPVTPRRGVPGATVRDDHGAGRATASMFPGDVAGGDEVAVPAVSAVRTREVPAARSGDATAALGTRRGGAAFVDAHHDYPDERSLIGQGLGKVGASPSMQPPVLGASHTLVLG